MRSIHGPSHQENRQRMSMEEKITIYETKERKSTTKCRSPEKNIREIVKFKLKTMKSEPYQFFFQRKACH